MISAEIAPFEHEALLDGAKLDVQSYHHVFEILPVCIHV